MGEFKNRMDATISDQHLTIIGEDSPEHIRYIAHPIDGKMQELGQKSVGLDTTRKAILTSVNIMHERAMLEGEDRRL